MMRLYSIHTGFFKLDGGAMFGVVPKTIWNRLHAADENNLCEWAMRCLLIEDGDRLILIDNGIGDKQDSRFLSHYHLHGDQNLDSSLRKHGFARNDVTDVFLTHLHFDHCGGSIVRKGEQLLPAFKNATYWSNERHWKWAVEPNDREKASFLKENILPIQESGRLRMVQMPVTAGSDLVDFSDHVKIRFVFGHTDAMMLPQIQYKGKTIVFVADLLPSAWHIPIPYIMAYDMFPLASLQEKKSFLSEAVGGNYLLFFEHDPYVECCSLMQAEKRIVVDENFAISDI
jgi:glyoxylase-like metal-dependent hydrolase (beta-lactamase superfamily II)